LGEGARRHKGGGGTISKRGVTTHGRGKGKVGKVLKQTRHAARGRSTDGSSALMKKKTRERESGQALDSGTI